MKVSIVMPTFNCGSLIHRTLHSIRLAGGSDLEIILQDGAGEFADAGLAESFPDLPLLVFSEPDGGQYDAINRGFARATGDILAWINAGDVFMPGAIDNAVAAFSRFSEVKWITGLQTVADEIALRKIRPAPLFSDFEIRLGLCHGRLGHLQQEGMFWRRELWEQSGGLDTSLSLAADFELWTRFAAATPLHRFDLPLAAFSYHGTNRSVTSAGQYGDEVLRVVSGLPCHLKTARRFMKVVSYVWRGARRIPLLPGILGLIIRLIRVPMIRVISFKGGGGSFSLTCTKRPAWFAF